MKKDVVSGILWLGLSNILVMFSKLIVTAILSRILTPNDFGLVAAVMIVISFADIFWMMGVGQALVQKYKLNSEDKFTGFVLNICFGILIFLLVYVFSEDISLFVGIENEKMLVILSLVFVINSISGVSESLLQRNLQFKKISLVNIISLIGYGFFAIIFAFMGLGAWALILGYIIQSLIKSGLSIILCPVSLWGRFSINSAKSLLYFGSGHTLAKAINNFAVQGDNLVVSRVLGTASLGFYNRSYQILMIPVSIMGSTVEQVLFPAISRVQKDKSMISDVFINTTTLMALFSLPITIVFFVNAKDIIVIMLGSNWSNSIVAFQILILSLFFRMSSKISDSIIKSIGAVYRKVWIQLTYAILVVSLAFIGLRWGIEGVALTTSISIVIQYSLLTLLVYRLVKFQFSKLIKYLLPILLMSIVLFISLSIINNIVVLNYSFLQLIFSFIIFCFLFFIYFKYILTKMMPNSFIVYFHNLIESVISNRIGSRFKKVIMKLVSILLNKKN